MNEDAPGAIALDPAGPFAAPLVNLSWTLFIMGGCVLAVVIAATAVALFGSTGLKQKLGGDRTVIIGGVAFPIVVLSGVLVYGLLVTSKVAAPPAPSDLRVRITGEMWWWRATYLDGEATLFETANEIHIPVGQTVAFELVSADVIHSFWVPQLGGKMDMIPGRTNVLRVAADETGVFRGQCAEFCGGAHALMAFEVVAEPQDAFDAWSKRQAAAASAAKTADHPGLSLFAGSGCGACHAVRGTQANGQMGPDLTHVGERRKLAGGILVNDPATLRAFIADAGRLKPGIRMPTYKRLSEAEVDTIAAWLETGP